MWSILLCVFVKLIVLLEASHVITNSNNNNNNTHYYSYERSNESPNQLLHIKKYQYVAGHCLNFNVQFIASLVSRNARSLFSVFSDSRMYSKKIRFDLYTRQNPDQMQPLVAHNLHYLRQSYFNDQWPVRLVIHGWNGRSDTCSNAAIKDAYLAHGDFNVILVDWSDYSWNLNYLQIVFEVENLAKQINEFTNFLNIAKGINFEDIYLIGHSAGAHLAGVAGKLLEPPAKYGVIFGLDPGGPVHSAIREKWRLAATDALYVETIQTDIALFGYPNAELSHASFFPNWGLGQPHCPNETATEPISFCDHFSALYYFAESIRRGTEGAFGGLRCHSYESVRLQTCHCGRKRCPADVQMGGEPAVPKQGVFYLSTRNKQPYGYGSIRMKRPLNSTLLRI